MKIKPDENVASKDLLFLVVAHDADSVPDETHRCPPGGIRSPDPSIRSHPGSLEVLFAGQTRALSEQLSVRMRPPGADERLRRSAPRRGDLAHSPVVKRRPDSREVRGG